MINTLAYCAEASMTKKMFLWHLDVLAGAVRGTSVRVFVAFFDDGRFVDDVGRSAPFCRRVVDSIVAAALAAVRPLRVDTPVTIVIKLYTAVS